MKSVEEVAAWAAEQGRGSRLLCDTFNSFGVDSMLANASQMSGRYMRPMEFPQSSWMANIEQKYRWRRSKQKMIDL